MKPPILIYKSTGVEHRDIEQMVLREYEMDGQIYFTPLCYDCGYYITAAGAGIHLPRYFETESDAAKAIGLHITPRFGPGTETWCNPLGRKYRSAQLKEEIA